MRKLGSQVWSRYTASWQHQALNPEVWSGAATLHRVSESHYKKPSGSDRLFVLLESCWTNLYFGQNQLRHLPGLCQFFFNGISSFIALPLYNQGAWLLYYMSNCWDLCKHKLPRKQIHIIYIFFQSPFTLIYIHLISKWPQAFSFPTYITGL